MIGMDEMPTTIFVDPLTNAEIYADWDFVITYYPDYDHSDDIAREEDLYCALYDECDEYKMERVKSLWGESREEWEEAHNFLYDEIVYTAINNYRHQRIYNNGKLYQGAIP